MVVSNGLFQKKIEPPCWGYRCKFPGGRKKVVGITGDMPKFEGRTKICRGVNAKKVKNSEGDDKIDWKSKEVNFKKIDILNRGVQFFSGRAQYTFSF